MATYYPCNQTSYSMCRTCVTVQSGASSCCTSSTSKNSSGSQAWSCSSYCNVGCNSICNTGQGICAVHSQYIKDHADVGAYPGGTVNPNDFIHLNWTPAFWNSLIGKLNTAEAVGKTSSQGSGGYVSAPHASEDVATANLYNQIRSKITNFNTYYSTVSNDQLISATVANAMKTAYEDAKFDSSVCDVCNAGDQSIHGGCNCNCSCDCSCSCGCSCGPCSCSCGPCSCSCGPCSCSCGPCSCSCSCSKPA